MREFPEIGISGLGRSAEMARRHRPRHRREAESGAAWLGNAGQGSQCRMPSEWSGVSLGVGPPGTLPSASVTANMPVIPMSECVWTWQ
ncbi:hypothetical protein SAMN05660976_01189 [Nonomuraea pusilla]|uniref:Uncharacterized protein n=1 Tax=Nonomuraea pusilla TaxID=46177 RepID=A0A1H7JNW7_9ACTN|nr:hypothetical protein SAMN05660976_01189 [Nonomuraea pusilla]